MTKLMVTFDSELEILTFAVSLSALVELLTVRKVSTLRAMVDTDGLKFKVDEGTWSPPMPGVVTRVP